MTEDPAPSLAIRDAPLRIRVTGLGAAFIVAALILGIAATNTGNNNLYLALAQLCAMLIVSGVVSVKNLRNLEFTLEPETELFAKQAAPVRLSARNVSRWLPNYFTLVYLQGMRRPYLLPFLPPRQTRSESVPLVFPRRGWIEVDRLMVLTRFPFGFFRKERRHRMAARLLVYPEILSFEGVTRRLGYTAGSVAGIARGRGPEIRKLREYAAGDDLRDIHWKNTAKAGKVMLRERQADEVRRVVLRFDNRVPRSGPETKGFTARFEALVSEVATAALFFLEDGCEVKLLARGTLLDFGQGETQRRGVLRALAEIAPEAESVPLPWAGDWRAADILEFGPGGPRP